MAPRSLGVGSVSLDGDCVLHIHRECVVCAVSVFEFLDVSCGCPRYLTTAILIYGASTCIMALLFRGCVVITASWREARTGGSRDQPRTARELSGGVLFSTE